jgi:hypothetical protein
MAEENRVHSWAPPTASRQSINELFKRRTVLLILIRHDHRPFAAGTADGGGVFSIRRSDDQDRAKRERAWEEID